MLTNKLMGAAGGADKLFVEDVFSTYLYTGNGSTQTITNGIDLSGKGGLVWCKERDTSLAYHTFWDSARGAKKYLLGPLTQGQADASPNGISFNSDGFVIAGSTGGENISGSKTVSWTFRKAPKFFDVVTYTGDEAARTIAHDLGSVPGMIIIKRADGISDWHVYHTSLGNAQRMRLNVDAAAVSASVSYWNLTSPTASVFSIGNSATVNTSGGTYVAYLFAYDAGGFGASGTDNVISCGSWTTAPGDSGDYNITLGWEPQYILIKRTDASSNWFAFDTMRGLGNVSANTGVGIVASPLYPNLSNAEAIGTQYVGVSSTGFNAAFSGGGTYIYIAIRRGPMRTPTSGTSVFSPNAVTGAAYISTGYPVDMAITADRNTSNNRFVFDRLRGSGVTAGSSVTKYLYTNSTVAEMSQTGYGAGFADNAGFSQNWWSSENNVWWNFRRAPGFFDVVCYTGTGVARTVNHNLGVAPEMMIIKSRSSATNWAVYSASQGATKAVYLNSNGTPVTSAAFFNDTAPTASVFTVNFSGTTNDTGLTYVAYLFASCPGVSKVGSYTGNGSSQTINCGFTAGARFVLIKATSTAGDWIVYDSARGIISANDPHLSLNTTAAEVTTDDSIDPDSTGFIVNQVAATNINVNGASYIYLSIS